VHRQGRRPWDAVHELSALARSNNRCEDNGYQCCVCYSQCRPAFAPLTTAAKTIPLLMKYSPNSWNTRRQFSETNCNHRVLYDDAEALPQDIQNIEYQFVRMKPHLVGDSSIETHYPNLKRVLVTCLRLRPENRPACDELLEMLQSSRPSTQPEDSNNFKDMELKYPPAPCPRASWRTAAWNRLQGAFDGLEDIMG
jgi:hypothetical protein